MTVPEFLSLAAVRPTDRFRPVARSPMERRLREAGARFEERDGRLVAVGVPGEEARAPKIRDVTHVRELGPEQEPVETRAGYAALEIDGPGATRVMQRLTEVPLGDLPTAGMVAHVRAWIFREGDERYRLHFEQEHGDYLWEVVVDAAEPLGGGPAGTP